jgi:hypothetical protein
MFDSNLSWALLTALWLVVGVFALVPAVMSPMMFDAPGSISNPFTVGAAASFAALPFVCLAAAVLPWIFRHWPLAKWLFALPLINIGIIIIFFVAIERLSGGSFGRRSR